MYMMKKALLILIILISASAVSAQDISLSVQDCITLSESNNPYIKKYSNIIKELKTYL